MIEYEQQDLDKAKEIISKGFLMDANRQPLALTEANIINVAKSYYVVRLRTFDPQTGDHL